MQSDDLTEQTFEGRALGRRVVMGKSGFQTEAFTVGLGKGLDVIGNFIHPDIEELFALL